MRLKLLLPTNVEIDEEVLKVTAEAQSGAFTLLPRHVDFAAPLAAGILSYETTGGEAFVAVNGGVLVKCGDEVRVAATDAARGKDLGKLEEAIRERFERLGEGENRAQRAIQRIEADFVKRFIDLEEYGQA
jgi:F-type H+-transporting ATPase subunit epsilon